MVVFIGIMLIILFALGFPMFLSLVLTTMLTFVFYLPMGLSTVIQQSISGISTFVLLAIPMFIFAADIMTAGYTSNRLIDFVKAFLGHIHGGLGISLAGACTIFGAISGSTQATVVAIGKPMRNSLIEEGYGAKFTNGLIVSASNIATLIPPSMMMIIYCVLTGVSVAELFLAGIGPGLFVFLMFSLYTYFYSRKNNIPRTKKTTWKEKFSITKKSLLALGFPVLIVGGIYSGIFSPTEAAAIAVLYAALCELLIYKTIKLSDIKKIALSSGAVTAIVFILIAFGQTFSWLITYARVPQEVTTLILGSDPSAIKVLTIVSVSFFVSCMIVDPIVACLILVPIFYPAALIAGIDPIHLGIIVTIQSGIGGITPPFGVNLFTAVAAFNESYGNVVKGVPPFLIMFILFSVLIIIFPQIATVYRIFL